MNLTVMDIDGAGFTWEDNKLRCELSESDVINHSRSTHRPNRLARGVTYHALHHLYRLSLKMHGDLLVLP